MQCEIVRWGVASFIVAATNIWWTARCISRCRSINRSWVEVVPLPNSSTTTSDFSSAAFKILPASIMPSMSKSHSAAHQRHPLGRKSRKRLGELVVRILVQNRSYSLDKAQTYQSGVIPRLLLHFLCMSTYRPHSAPLSLLHVLAAHQGVIWKKSPHSYAARPANTQHCLTNTVLCTEIVGLQLP